MKRYQGWTKVRNSRRGHGELEEEKRRNKTCGGVRHSRIRGNRDATSS